MESAKAFVEANAVKERAHTEGYIHALSFYGVLTEIGSTHSEYRRIEVLSNVFWNSRIIELIWRFFKQFKPNKTYTIWLYNKERDAITQVGAYD